MRLLLVSNRLPVTVRLHHGEVVITDSAGGLATGVRSLHETSDSLWIGWPGDLNRFETNQRAHIDRELQRLRSVPVQLTPTEISQYYQGFSNGVIWPLFHYLTDHIQLDANKNWATYKRVNERFARKVAEHYQTGSTIWIHDYHLFLVPGILRRLIPEASIGFFLHTPFPSSEVFRILPWRAEVLEGVLGADLIGFHAYSYRRHFSRALLHVLGIQANGGRFSHSGRQVQLGVFPMGVDAARFSQLAEQPDIISEAQVIRERSGERRLLLGIDRLDHSKGLSRRLLALERLLEREPGLRRKIRLIQVVVPSRTKVEAYAALRRELDEIVGRINGAYATINSVPIHYLFRSVSEQQLVALYKAADVMLVTPLRDGMNLVAKEFLASRNDEDGVLVLSEFAGAAAELGESILVNPYDIDGVAAAIKQALNMPQDEKRARMRALRRRVQAYDSHRWANSFIQTLDSTKHKREMPGVSSQDEIHELLKRLRSADRLLLLLDYDGTLVSFASTPQLATSESEIETLLRSLAARPGTTVHLLSGRSRDTLDHWLRDLEIGLHAEHGFWSRRPDGSWEPVSSTKAEWKAQILPILEQFTIQTPGSLIEEKTAAVAWHYRMSDPDLGALEARELRSRLERELSRLPVELLQGDKVIEVRTRDVNKGTVATRLLSHKNGRVTVLAMGDDYTDEDLFAALPPDGFSVHVGSQPSRARYRLADPAAARGFLRKLLE